MLREQGVHVVECAGAAPPLHGHALPPHLLLHEEQSFLIECRARRYIRFEENISHQSETKKKRNIIFLPKRIFCLLRFKANGLRQNEANIVKKLILIQALDL
jgi:hypothetical protein